MFSQTPRWRDAIAYSVVVDGAGADTVVAEALGSRRFEVIVRGPGGHSWSDFGAPNPIIALARAIEILSRTPVPASPKTTFNVGVIRGGTSVNSIPESASMRVDLRSTSMAEIDRLERALRDGAGAGRGGGKSVPSRDRSRDQSHRSCRVKSSRSAIVPQANWRQMRGLLKVIRAVDAQLGNTAQVQRASTDANIPLSLGREADRDRRRRFGRRRAHVARMVRLQWTGARTKAHSAYNAGTVWSRRMRKGIAPILFWQRFGRIGTSCAPAAP